MKKEQERSFQLSDYSEACIQETIARAKANGVI